MKKVRGIVSLLVILSIIMSASLVGSVAVFGATVKNVTICLSVSDKNVYKQFISRFNDTHKDIQITPLWGKDQNMLVAANKAPDILYTGDLHLPYQKDIFLDLNAYIKKDNAKFKISDYYSNLLSPLKIDGKQYALPLSFNVGLLYYNKKLFDQAGLKYPTATWTSKDFLDAAQKLTIKDAKGNVTQWGCTSTFGWWGEWLIHVRQAGGDIMKNGNVILNTPQAINGLKRFFDKTTLGTYKISPGPKDDALGGFAGQKTGMDYGGHTGLWLGYNNIKDFDWDVQVLPKGIARNKGGEMALDGYGISKKSVNAAAAWEVLKFMCGKEGLNLLADMGKPVASQSVAKALLSESKSERSNPKNLEAVYSALSSGMTLPREKDFINMAIQVVQPNIDLMLEGKLTPAEAGKQATDKGNAYLKQMKGK